MLALGYEPEPRAEEVKEAGLPLLTAWTGLFGTIWYYLVPFGTIWYHLVLFGNIWLLFGTIWYFLILQINTGYLRLLHVTTCYYRLLQVTIFY